MPYTPNAVVSSGFPLDDTTFTYYLTGLTLGSMATPVGQAANDAVVGATAGLAVAQDVTAASSVKLAGDGDVLFGRIFVAENHDVQGFVTAAVQRRFKERMPTVASHGIVVGNRVVGGGNGLVKKDTANTGAGLPTNPLVVEVGTDYVVVEKLS